MHFRFGSPYENRTRDSSVKGMRLNPLTNGPFCFWECKDIGTDIYIQKIFKNLTILFTECSLSFNHLLNI